jgi:hypothetical protein
VSAPPKEEFTRKRLMNVVLWGVFMAILFFGVGLGIKAIISFSGAGEAAGGSIVNLTGQHLLAEVLVQQGVSDIALASTLPYIFVILGFAVGAAIGYLTYHEE